MGHGIRRIGVLTGGGDAPGLNAVIRAVVRTAINKYGWEVLGIEDGFDGLLFQREPRKLGLQDVRGILPMGGTILGTTNRGNPFAYRVQVDGKPEVKDLSRDAIARIRDLSLDAVLVIGGDGSLKIAHELSLMGAPVVGIPKTIDNDLSATDVTFGFDTALHTATDALDKLHTTAESHHRVMILELMGRDAGWIALEAGLAGGADVILIPEIPYRLESIEKCIARREAAHRTFSIIVAAEGARPCDGCQLFQEEASEEKLARLGGVANHLAAQLALRIPQDVRATVLGHLQRGGSPTPFDRILGTRFGAAAVRLVAEGGLDKMVALHTPDIVAVDLSEAIGSLKRVQPDDELVLAARDMGIFMGDE